MTDINQIAATRRLYVFLIHELAIHIKNGDLLNPLVLIGYANKRRARIGLNGE